jgi:DNA-binding phage protein
VSQKRTMADVARQAGIKPDRLRSVELGVQPSIESAEAICAALGHSLKLGFGSSI